MAALAPYSRFRAVDDDNLPLVGGWIYTYAPGTSTPKAVYTDHTLGTPHTNPVELDANGEATIFIDGDTDFVLEDAAHVQRWGAIRASDGTKNKTLSGITLSDALTVTSTNINWSGNPSHAGLHTFENPVTFEGGALDFPGGVTITGEVTFDDETNLNPPSGTFTPAVAATGGTPVYTSAGYYTRVGDRVLIDVYVNVTSWGGATTGAVSITGLPIAAASITGQHNLPGFYVGSSASINFTGVVSGTTLAVKRLTGANFIANDGNVSWAASFSGSYKV